MHQRRRRCRESIKRRGSRQKKSDEEELRTRRRKIRKRKRKEEEKNGYSIMYCCCCCCVCYFGTFQQFSSRDFAFHPPPLPTILRAVELFSGSLIDRVRFEQTRTVPKNEGGTNNNLHQKGLWVPTAVAWDAQEGCGISLKTSPWCTGVDYTSTLNPDIIATKSVASVPAVAVPHPSALTFLSLSARARQTTQSAIETRHAALFRFRCSVFFNRP